MRSPVVPEIRRLTLPGRGADKFFEDMDLADQWIADRERLEHENACLREENAELKATAADLRSDLEWARDQRRRAHMAGVVEGLRA